MVGLHTAAHQVETASRPVVVPARGGMTVRADSLFDGFRDLTYAYCFGPRSYELVTADLVDAGGRRCWRPPATCPAGPARDIDPDVGLEARWNRPMGELVLESVPGGSPSTSMSTSRDSCRRLLVPPSPRRDPWDGATPVAGRRDPHGWVRALQFLGPRRGDHAVIRSRGTPNRLQQGRNCRLCRDLSRIYHWHTGEGQRSGRPRAGSRGTDPSGTHDRCRKGQAGWNGDS